MTEPSTTKKPWFEWKTLAAPLVGLLITCVWGIITIHFGMKELNNVVLSLRETVVELRATVNEIGRNANDIDKEMTLMQFRVGSIESHLGLPLGSKRDGLKP